MIRPIRPEDEPLMVRFHEKLSDRTVYLRYFQPLKLSQRVAHERLTRICFIDYDREMALVTFAEDSDVVRVVAGDDVSEGAHRKEVITCDTGSHPAFGRQIRKKRNRRSANVPELLEVGSPGDLVGFGGGGRDVLIVVRQWRRKVPGEPEGSKGK